MFLLKLSIHAAADCADRIVCMKINQLKFAVLALTVATMCVFTSTAAETPTVSDVTGQWHGESQFTGISFNEAKRKKIQPQKIRIELQISTVGKVTGRLGDAELSGTVSEANRGWFGHLLRMKTNFIIEGKIVGAVAAGSDDQSRPVKIPFTFAGGQISGSVFAVYPIKYPYPFLNVRLNR